MKKLMLLLIVTLTLVCWGRQEYNVFGAAPVYGQPPPPPSVVCDPYYETCTYYNYFTAPYTDPDTMYFYYTVPPDWVIRERRERRLERERREHWEREHGYRP